MGETVFVLLMVFGHHRGGVAVIQQEFTSLERCEAARKHLEKAVEPGLSTLTLVRSQGCFKK